MPEERRDDAVLVVGLGNPGPQYAETPHNVGFRVVGKLAEEAGVRIGRPEARSLVGLADLEGKRVVLATPLTYMNLSGGAVRELLKKYELGVESLVVVSDELQLPLGAIRIRERGSAGGHNGIASVIESLGTDEFVRIRLGIGPDRPVPGEYKADYVLRPFPKAVKEPVDEMIDRAADAVRLLLRDGVARAMNEFNRKAPNDSAGLPPS